MKTKISSMLGIKYPIIQAGMVWVSGWRLASAVSDCGGLGLIGAGSMSSELLTEHIKKCRISTSKPFGVNIPLLRKDAADLVNVCLNEGINIFFTSAGNPKTFTPLLKEKGCIIVHVVANLKYALKAQEAGCHAVVGEGVEAGGHNGADQITTFCLIPQLVDKLNIPVIAAGGIVDGRGILAALSLGAEGVQIGTRFAATIESSAHENYKQEILNCSDQDTTLAFRKIGLVRMIKNDFAIRAMKAENDGWDENRLRELLASKRERAGIFEGDTVEGELEAGQGAGLIKDIPSVKDLFNRLITDYETATGNIQATIP